MHPLRGLEATMDLLERIGNVISISLGYNASKPWILNKASAQSRASHMRNCALWLTLRAE